jgi:hypothetical protein
MSSIAPPPQIPDDTVIPDISIPVNPDTTIEPKDGTTVLPKDDTTIKPKDDTTDPSIRVRPGQESITPHGDDVAPPAGLTPEFIMYMIGKMLSLSGSFTSIIMSVYGMIKGLF